jgi:CHAD domain-containing protein
MTLSFSQDVYTEMVQVQQAQIQALQNKIAELQARIDVLEQQSILIYLKPIYTMSKIISITPTGQWQDLFKLEVRFDNGDFGTAFAKSQTPPMP